MLYIYISNPSRSLQQGLPAKSEARWDLLGHKLDLLLLLDTCRPDAPLVSGIKRVKPLRNHGQGVSCVPFEENPTIGKVTNNIQQQLLGQHLIDMCKHVQATNCQSPDKTTHSLRGIIVKLEGAPVTKKGFGPELAMSDDRPVDNTSGHFKSQS